MRHKERLKALDMNFTIQGNRLAKCNLCEKKFTHKQNFYNHFTAIHLNIPVNCHVCGKRFAESIAYYKHFNAVHLYNQNLKENVPKRNGGRKCTKAEDSSCYVNQAHHGLKAIRPSLKCSRGSCDYSTSYPYNLIRHQLNCKGQVMAIETEEKLACKVCGKLYSLGSLRAHMLHVHTQVRKFLCSQCGQAFKMKHHFTKHYQTAHSGLRYKCDNAGCNKSFTWERHLLVHKAAHCIYNNKVD